MKNLSGSFNLEDKKEEKSLSKEEMMEIYVQDALLEESLHQNFGPCYTLAGSGYDWFYDVDLNKMVKILRGQNVIPLGEVNEKNGTILVFTGYNAIWIPASDIIDTGWN